MGERMTRVYADILVANVGMQRLCDELGFTLDPMPDAGVIPAVLELGSWSTGPVIATPRAQGGFDD